MKLLQKRGISDLINLTEEKFPDAHAYCWFCL